MLGKSKLIIGLGVAASVLLISVGVFLYIQSRSAQGVSIDFQVPDKVLAGVPFDFLVGVSNESKSLLKEVRLSISLPENMAFVGQPSQKTVEYRELGMLGAGTLTQERFQLIAVGGDNSIQQIQISATYSPANLGARFEKEKNIDIPVGNFGLSLDVVTPTKVFSGEDFEILITYRNVAEDDYRNLELVVEYPPSFNFVKSDLEPDVSNREWRLGDLRKNSEGKLKISGNLI
ncbi:MAG: hypothetical protein AAB885_02795, partial [Patescibacteria group bacterium]